MSSNERLEVRKGYKKLVRVISQHWDEEVEYVCRDLSPRGIFVKTNFPLSAGESIIISFTLPDTKREFNLFGQIVHVSMPKRKSDNGTSGMGIKFLDVTPFERLLIREAIRKIPPPVPA